MTHEGSPATVLITSTRDEASATIASGLVKNHDFQSTEIALMGKPVFQKGSLLLVTIDTKIISPPDLDTYFNPQAYIFLSRHRAESGIPSLTVHTTGNFTDKPSLGGRPKEVGGVNPDLQKNYLIALNKRKDEIKDYQLTIEATHHGPTSLKRPVLFVELGSSEKNWGDERAGKVIGDALIEALTQGRSWDRVAIAFGGPHYPAKFNKLLLESDVAPLLCRREALPRRRRQRDVRSDDPEDLAFPVSSRSTGRGWAPTGKSSWDSPGSSPWKSSGSEISAGRAPGGTSRCGVTP